MLVIRMQRTGRKGHAQFRVVAQDSRRTPTSGRIVAALGSYNPHNKEAIINKEKIQFYLDHGAQPSDRVARLLKSEGLKLPSWVKVAADKTRTVRNAEKRRSTTPVEPATETTETEVPAEAVPETQAVDTEDTAVEAEETTEEAPTKE